MTRWLGRVSIVLSVCGEVWALLLSVAITPGQTAYSQNIVGGQGDDAMLQVHSTLLPTGIEQITVVDPRAKSIAIYHVEPATAKIQLKSVRNLVWDLQMEHFNGQAPLPSELRQVQP